MAVEVNCIENKTKDEIIDVLCIECNRPTKHRVVVSLDEDCCEYDDSDRLLGNWECHDQIIRCLGCQSVSFRHTIWSTEIIDPCTGAPEETTERLYPKRDMNSLKAKSFWSVPNPLRRIYMEVIDCYNGECSTLAAAGLRAVVEGICADQSITDGPVSVPAKGGGIQIIRKDNLEGKIFGLHEKGILTKSSAETLHEHRYLGNDAVHELKRPAVGELKLAIEIIEHTLEHLYEMPKKAATLKQQMASRNINGSK